MWPHKFRAVYSITLHGEQLRTHLRVINTDDKPFEFTAALHSYFEVLDITKAQVKGLKGESESLLLEGGWAWWEGGVVRVGVGEWFGGRQAGGSASGSGGAQPPSGITTSFSPL